MYLCYLGLATSFFNDRNRNLASSMLDLLIEAKQDIPSWLEGVAADGRCGGSGRRTGKGRFGGGGFGARDYRQTSGGSGSGSGSGQRQRSGGSGGYGGNNGYGGGGKHN